MINYQSIAENILHYYHRNRCVGHTYTMVNGIKNSDNKFKITVLTANQAHAHQLKRVFDKSVSVVAMSEGGFHDKLVGRKGPLAIDNFALSFLLQGLVEENNRLSIRNEKSEDAIIKLTRGMTRQTLENERLTSANETLKDIVRMHKEYADEIREILDSAGKTK